MSIGITTSVWLAALLAAAAPQRDEGEGKLEKYGGTYSCKDQAVKDQVVRALSSGKSNYGSSAIGLANGSPQFDGSAVAVTFGKATAVVSKPGTSTGPTGLRLARSGAGADMDVLMCRYRRPSSKSWTSITASDLEANGQLRKRMPAEVKAMGRIFAPSDIAGQSEDFVTVVVAAGVGGKSAPAKVAVLTKGLRDKAKGPAKGGGNAAKKILAEADPDKWSAFKYGVDYKFPEAEGVMHDWDSREFDCSTFVWLVYKRAGIDYTFTNTAGLAQLGGGEFVEVKTPRPGDLVVWNPNIGSKINHVGIITGNPDEFIDNGKSKSVNQSYLHWSTYQDKHVFIRRKGL